MLRAVPEGFFVCLFTNIYVLNVSRCSRSGSSRMTPDLRIVPSAGPPRLISCPTPVLSSKGAAGTLRNTATAAPRIPPRRSPLPASKLRQSRIPLRRKPRALPLRRPLLPRVGRLPRLPPREPGVTRTFRSLRSAGVGCSGRLRRRTSRDGPGRIPFRQNKDRT